MNRWVGLGVIAHNVVNIGRAIKKRQASLSRRRPSRAPVQPRRLPRRFLRYRDHVDHGAKNINFAPGSS
jgi:hypothetical protein